MANAINSLNYGNNVYTFTLPYGSCSTAAGTAAKTVDLDNFSLETGARVAVKFTVTNTASSPTLNVDGTGAKAIYYNGAAITAGYLKANKTYEFIYNGTQWDLIGDVDTNTTYSFKGAVSTIKDSNLTASRALVSNSSGKVAVSAVTSTELGYLDGVTSAIQTQLDGKAASGHTHSAATTSAAGLMSASDKSKLDGITSSADSVSFTQKQTSGTEVGTITINGTGTKLYAPTNTDTHYTTGLKVGASATATANAAASNGSVYLNVLDNTTVRDSHKIVGSGATTVTADANGVITISSTDNNTVYTHPTSSGNKHIPSGGSSGQILRWSADGTAAWGADNNTTYSNMTAATSSAAGKAGLVPAPAAGKQSSFLRGDGTWVVPTNTTYSNFVKSGSGAKAGLVPAPSTTAGTTKYLREDGNWVVPPDTNTTYSAATTSANGLMTTAMVTKLNGIADGANKYSLPTASSSTLGGVKTTSTVTSASGYTPCPIISGVPYYKNTDSNTTYKAGTGISLSGTTFSNSGVRSIATGSSNGTISVNTNGTSANVAVKGLGSAAYTASTAYAPSGYGLGSYAQEIDYNKIDAYYTNGWYQFNRASNPVTINGHGISYGRILVIGSNEASATQLLYASSQQGLVFQRFTIDDAGNWGEWKSVNPRMAENTEYLTTEIYADKPVYTKLIKGGTPSNGMTISGGSNITIIRQAGRLGTSSLPYGAKGDSWYAYTSTSGGTIYLYCSNNFQSATYGWWHQIWYYKQ